MTDCVVEHFSLGSRLVTEPHPYIAVTRKRDYLACLGPGQLLPCQLHVLQRPVHGEPILDVLLVSPSIRWSKTPITSRSNTCIIKLVIFGGGEKDKFYL